MLWDVTQVQGTLMGKLIALKKNFSTVSRGYGVKKKNKTERKRSVSAFKDTIPFYVSLGMFFSGHKNRPFLQGIY